MMPAMASRAQAVDQEPDDHRQRHRQHRREMILVDESADRDVLTGFIVAEIENPVTGGSDLEQSQQRLGAGEDDHRQQQPRGVLRREPHRNEQARERRQQRKPAVLGGRRNNRNRSPDSGLARRGEALDHRRILAMPRQHPPQRAGQRDELNQRIDQQQPDCRCKHAR
jgi:hypothetical protein